MTFPVALTGISKRFGSIQALTNVDFRVEKGSLHAIVGENGAGKTTLMRVLYGAVQPDSGVITIDGQNVNLPSSEAAIGHGIGMVSQHYAIIPQLTCLQNLMLGAEGGSILHPKKLRERAVDLADRMGFQFDWNRTAEGLSPAACQKLEILKLLWRGSRVMILDEPTSMLSPSDSESLFARLKHLASEGSTIILVTHRLRDVVEHCANVTVMRGGVRITEAPVAEFSLRELADLVVGGQIGAPPERTQITSTDVLAVDKLEVHSGQGHDAVKEAAFRVRAGEVVGIAGVDGNGQRELFRAIGGILQPHSGVVCLNGLDISKLSTVRRVALGLRLIPEDRQEEALNMDWSLEENAALGMQRVPPFAKGRLIDREGRQQAATAIAEKLGTKFGNLNQPIGMLSGGNQQRFIAGRALFGTPKLIVAFQPSHGLDIDGTSRFYVNVRRSCADGAGALIFSYDLDELLEFCDRIIVMNRGRVLEPRTDQALDREAIGRLMVVGED